MASVRRHYSLLAPRIPEPLSALRIERPPPGMTVMVLENTLLLNDLSRLWMDLLVLDLARVPATA